LESEPRYLGSYRNNHENFAHGNSGHRSSIHLGLHGVVLWLASVLHAAMGGWCIAWLLKNPSEENKVKEPSK
jgi:hypothetical protein